MFARFVAIGFLFFGAMLAEACAGPAELSVVGFDAPAVVIAEPVNPAVVNQPLMGGQLMRLRIPVTTLIASEFVGDVSEFVVEIFSPTQSMRVVDYWPKNESYSEIDGSVAVQSNQKTDRNFSFTASGGYEPFAGGSANGSFHQQTSSNETYQRKPPMQILTSSGAIQRGFGVHYKFRSGPLPLLEGARDVAILFEVPDGWRADLLQITMRASGQATRQLAGQSRTSRSLGAARMWIAAHREGDPAAAIEALRYVAQERALRALAAASQNEISERSFPTWWHRVGAALDVVDPRIPGNYLGQVIFGARATQFVGGTQRLPVDVRVAVLDYWEQRDVLLSLASTTPGRLTGVRSEVHMVSKVPIDDQP